MATPSHGDRDSWRHIGPTHPFEPFPDDAVWGGVVARFSEMVRRYPDRLAVRCRGESLTYAALDARAAQTAAAVSERTGPDAGPVALLLPQGCEAVVGILGVLKAGKPYLALDPSFPQERTRFILEDSRAQAVVASAETLAPAEELATAVGGKVVVPLEGPSAASSAEVPVRLGMGDDLAGIFYTSGTTGRPKGVMRTHAMLLHSVAARTADYHLTKEDRIGLVASHSSAVSTGNIFGALLNGAALLPFDVRREGLGRLADWLLAERVTLIHMVASLFREFAAGLRGEGLFPDLRLLILGSETIRRSDVALYRKHFSDGCLLRLGMGFTEGGGTGTRMMITRQTELPEDPMPVGYAADGSEVMIVDEAGNRLAPGEVGEIVIRSRFLSPGYWGRPDLTEKAFRTDEATGLRQYRTGDLGRMDPDGCCYHLGRVDQQVKVRGHRVELLEIEAALCRLPDIADAAAVLEKDPLGENRIVAHLVMSGMRRPTVSRLRAALAQRLPPHMIPSRFVFTGSLARTATGKIDRRALAPAPDATGRQRRPDLDADYVAPRDDLETWLAELWAQMLGLERVGVADGLFDLGAHSVTVARVLGRVASVLGTEAPPAAFYAAPTVADLAAFVADAQGRERANQVVATWRRIEAMSDDEVQRVLSADNPTMVNAVPQAPPGPAQ